MTPSPTSTSPTSKSPTGLGPTESLLDAKRRTDPAEFSRILRERGPIFWWEPDRFWVVTDFELASQILKGTDFSANRGEYFMARLGTVSFKHVGQFLNVVGKMMTTSDPPAHTQRRRLAQFGIADHVIDAFRPTVERTVDQLVEQVAARGGDIELVSQIALPLPCTVLADLFSIPPESRSDFYAWANAMTQFFGGASEDIERDAKAANNGAGNLHRYFTELIAKRRASPAGDFLSNLLEHQKEIGLDDDEVISQAVMMLVAGSITTTDQICNDMIQVLEHGPALGSLTGPKLDAALEEATRLDPSVNFMFRVASKDLTLGGAAIKSLQLAFISAHAVNRDPAVFPAPDELRLDRPRNPHMGYGAGLHYCLGARLGRIQLTALFARLIARFPKLALSRTTPPVRKHESLGFSGYTALTLSVG